MIEDLLVFRGSLLALMSIQISVTAYVDGIQGAKSQKAGRRPSQLVDGGGLQRFNGSRGITVVECETGTKRGYEIKADGSVFWKALL
jgi:hypothetical protein